MVKYVAVCSFVNVSPEAHVHESHLSSGCSKSDPCEEDSDKVKHDFSLINRACFV